METTNKLDCVNTHSQDRWYLFVSHLRFQLWVFLGLVISKLENVLFDSPARNKIKVVDFGIAGIVTSVQSDKNTAATLKYMTPEMIAQANSVASPAMDVWAIGIMTYCMLFNRLPFSSPNKDEIKSMILTQPYRLSKSKPITNDCQ